MRFLAVFFFSLPSLIHGKDASFISPAYQHSTGTGKYGADSQWSLGSTQVVAFSTTWDEYRLEFWQQDLASGAKKSSKFNYTQKAGQNTPQSFQWTVQTYELQLSNSPVFFFWLHNNDNSSLQQTSAYFNITIDGTSSTLASSSSGLTTSSVSTGSTTTSSVLSSAFTSTTPISSPSGTPDTSKGLSAGAAAGVGVGAALGGILLGVAGLLYWKRNRLRTGQQIRSELPDSQPMGYSTGSPGTVAPISEHNPKPAEAPSRDDLSPVELG